MNIAHFGYSSDYIIQEYINKSGDRLIPSGLINVFANNGIINFLVLLVKFLYWKSASKF